MKTTIAILFLVSCAFAYPGGAPEESCESMLPSHDGAKPQDTPSPYTLLAEENGSDVTVSILAPTNGDFVGFFLQGRNADGTPIGTFTVQDPEVAEVMTCPGGTDNAVTQKSDDPQTKVVVSWTGPAEPITFILTVLEDEETFWVGQTATIGKH